MRMLSGRMHWLTVGLALLVSAQGFATKEVRGQAPLNPAASAAKRQDARMASYNSPMAMPYGVPQGMTGMPGGGMMPDGPTSVSFQGPAPMDYSSSGSCDSYCNATGGCSSCGGCNACGGSACGGRGCGLMRGAMGGGRGGMRGCNVCGGAGCMACAGGACGACGGAGCSACGGGNGCLFGGALLGLLGPLAPYSEGGQGAQRWFDVYAGTMGLARTSNFGGFSSSIQNPTTGQFPPQQVFSTNGISGTPVLRSSDLDLDKIRYGLEVVANLQTGVGSNLEFRYFGLNNWQTSATASTVTSGNPTLFSVFSLYGTQPAGGFDDTDRSFIHTISYNSELHNGEVNYRRRWVNPDSRTQGSFLAGVRYFDLDERFGFNATGSNDNTFTFNQLRFFNFDTNTRNELTGFQVGGDFWVNLVPGILLGVESKGGIFGNHAEVESVVSSNSIVGASEFIQDARTAYLAELTASMVYRLTYSWSIKTSYNFLYIDNVALAAENVNTRDLSNALGGGAFTLNRQPFLNIDGEVVYQGWSIGGEWLY